MAKRIILDNLHFKNHITKDMHGVRLTRDCKLAVKVNGCLCMCDRLVTCRVSSYKSWDRLQHRCEEIGWMSTYTDMDGIFDTVPLKKEKLTMVT